MCLTAYLNSLPVATDNESDLDLLILTNTILNLARTDLALNQIVIPTLQTLDLILDAGILGKLGNTEAGTEVYVRDHTVTPTILNNSLLYSDQPTGSP